MLDQVFLNGQFLPAEQAHISPFDRGFLFGDGVYEVLTAYQQLPIHSEAHLQRLSKSLRAVDIVMSTDNLLEVINDLLKKNRHQGMYQMVYLQITRGIESPRKHVYHNRNKPSTFIYTQPIDQPKLKNQGLKAITHKDIRWQNCHIKSTNLLGNILAMQAANRQDCQAVLMMEDGYLTEAGASNILCILDNTVYTPKPQKTILAGITKSTLLKKLKKNGESVRSKTIDLGMLYRCQEVLLTSTTKPVAPICQINDNIIGNGQPGPYYKKCFQMLTEHLH
mgnify:CR=1 FL=1